MKESVKRLNSGNANTELPEHLAQVEAAPEDITITLEGRRHGITAVNRWEETDEGLILLTSAWGSSVKAPADAVAVQIGTGNVVLGVVNGAPTGISPVWEGPTELVIPQGGYVLVARDVLFAPGSSRYYLATCFRKGDVIKLRRRGQVIGHHELGGAEANGIGLFLDHPPMYTVTETTETISGAIAGDLREGLFLTVNGEAAEINEEGRFEHKLILKQGLQFVDIEIRENAAGGNPRTIVSAEDTGETDASAKTESCEFTTSNSIVKQSLTLFCKKNRPEAEQRVILWVDQRANSGKLQSKEEVKSLLERAKGAGVTDIALDVKGVEGYVSYFCTPLTNRPHISEIKHAGPGNPPPRLDLLQAFIDEGHPLGLRIHASMNVFAEGSILRGQYGILDLHPEWEQIVSKHQDGGDARRQRDSSAPGPVSFVNPLLEEVRMHQMDGFREVLAGYDVDGLILDRCRYDNETADFSPLTRMRFEDYLAEKGKWLHRWPEDVYRYDGNTRIDGPLVEDWWAFRAGVVTSFVKEIKEMVQNHNRLTGREVLLSAYVGSWYDTYYVNGANWASPDFRYDDRLLFQDGSIYTDDYRSAGYIRHLDFLMIGTYQDTLAEVEKYMAVGNIATCGEVPLYAGIAISQINETNRQSQVFDSAFRFTDGVMLFDASHIDWDTLSRSLKRG